MNASLHANNVKIYCGMYKKKKNTKSNINQKAKG